MRPDEGYWQALAKKYQMRMPRSDAKFTQGVMGPWIRKAGVTVQEYMEWGNYKLKGDFIRMNPEWSLHDFVGLMLELRESKEEALSALNTEHIGPRRKSTGARASNRR